ncbi:1-deoxy-D-xylulose 5-phosphate reductoisomerase [Thalassocella blandensis]|nr:1-deoxy-D-xylulose 5-phosphate reductoisomerase [Thalassocella blandensis]
MQQTLTVLGATGSIGVNTLDVVRQHPERFRVFALTAHKNIMLLSQQCLAFSPEYAVVADESGAAELRDILRAYKSKTEVLHGPAALVDVAKDSQVTTVMAAIVGAAGLSPTMAAVEAGKRVLLANKEALVMSGHLFTSAVKRNGGQLLPIDSEHNAIFQCLPDNFTSVAAAGIQKIILTGSGGPFRETALSELQHVTPAQACNHPNWSMGQKISVDSATMMNKGLEYIEACWLFNVTEDQLEVVVHPQSIIHSMVQYLDGSVLAQMGQPDMRTPIAHCMGWPDRIASGVEPLDFTRLSGLHFEAPDFQRFPCLQLAMNAWRSGGDYAVALNACNEVAVDRFLNGEIKFTQIAEFIDQILEIWDSSEPVCIDDVISADLEAREMADKVVRA